MIHLFSIVSVFAFGIPLPEVLADCKSWSYEGETGPEHWNSFCSTCNGSRQSPINVVTASVQLNESLGAFTLTNFNNVTGLNWTLTNNGHTAQVTNNQGLLQVSGGGLDNEYEVAQFHFHWGSNDTHGSEHTIDGMAYPMELHIVTWKRNYNSLTNALNYPDGVAVLGFFFEIQKESNTVFDKLVKNLANASEPLTVIYVEPFALGDLLPNTSQFYRYLGSLTTPPCTEAVVWSVFRNTIKISEEQIEAFRKLHSHDLDADNKTLHLENNFRPVQAMSGRVVTASFKEVATTTSAASNPTSSTVFLQSSSTSATSNSSSTDSSASSSSTPNPTVSSSSPMSSHFTLHLAFYLSAFVSLTMVATPAHN